VVWPSRFYDRIYNDNNLAAIFFTAINWILKTGITEKYQNEIVGQKKMGFLLLGHFK
jgi:MFS superfamily sulfate permease-like transporter